MLTLVAVLACAASLHGSVRAEDKPHGADSPGYREAIADGLAEYQAGGYLEARTLFARAHALYPNARTLRGLGLVSFELRRYAESVGFLQQSLASNEKRLEGTMRADVERLLARAHGFVARLELALLPAETQVTVDGAQVALKEDTSLLLDVGTHELEFKSSAHRSEQRSLTVVGGERLQWKVSLAPADAPPGEQASELSPRASRKSDKQSRLARFKWISLGAAAGAVVLTGVAVGMREQRARALQDSCTSDTPRCSDLQSSGKAWRASAIGLGSLSAVLAGATVALFALDPPREHATPLQRALRSCALGGLSLTCQSQF